MKLTHGYESKDDGINEIIEDMPGSAFMALREVKWGEDLAYALDLRRYFVKNGQEIPGKGISFTTKEGPTNLANAFIKHGCTDNVSITSTLMQTDQDSLIQGIIENIPNDEMLDEFRYRYERAYTNMERSEPNKSAKEMLDKIFEKKEE